MLKKIVWLVFSFVFISLLPIQGCQKKSSSGSDKQEEVIRHSSSEKPKNYSLQDSTCRIGAGLLELQPVYIWDKDRVYSVEKDLSLFSLRSDLNGLQGEHIRGVVHGVHTQSIIPCRRRYSTYTEEVYSYCNIGQRGSEVRSGGELLHFCSNSGPYTQNSIEGIALSSIFNLEKAGFFYKSLAGSKDVKRSYLFILPKVERIYKFEYESGFPEDVRAKMREDREPDEVSKVIADNASYSFYEINNEVVPVFSVFPDSEDQGEILFGGMKLWNSSFVLGHEYGHHVFWTHTPSSSQAFMLTVFAKQGFRRQERPKFENYIEKNMRDNKYWFFDMFVEANTSNRRYYSLHGNRNNGAAELSHSAINEAFADLFGYYSIGAEEGFAENMGCFRKDREVESKRFRNGDIKILDENNLLSFLYKHLNADDNSDGCRFSYDDNHIIGAIFAHGFDKLLSIKTGSSSEDKKATSKAEYLLRWLDSYLDQASKIENPTGEDVFVLAVSTMHHIGLDELTQEQIKDQCETIEAMFSFDQMKDQLLSGC